MSDGVFARLSRWFSPSRERSNAALPEPSGDAVPPAAAEVLSPPEAEPAPQAESDRAQTPPIPGREAAAARPLPAYRPNTTPEQEARRAAAARAPEPSPSAPLSLTLSEAITLVQDRGGDAIELHFLRRELARRSKEGTEPTDLWPRIENLVGGRLRRVGCLSEGQTLTLERDS
jgi:hypothetical protein